MSMKVNNHAISLFFLFAGCLGPSVAMADDLADVIAANNAFYAALSARDAGMLAKVYAHDPYVANISPLNGALEIGWPGVEKWAKNIAADFKDLAVAPSDLHARVNGNTAWLVNTEHLKGTLVKTGASIEWTLISTNIYEKQGDSWLMVSHQGQVIPK
jgi:ketosteroid isomerase-like protein